MFDDPYKFDEILIELPKLLQFIKMLGRRPYSYAYQKSRNADIKHMVRFYLAVYNIIYLPTTVSWSDRNKIRFCEVISLVHDVSEEINKDVYEEDMLRDALFFQPVPRRGYIIYVNFVTHRTEYIKFNLWDYWSKEDRK